MLNSLNLSVRENKFHIEGYPNAVAIKRLDDTDARILQAIVLHHFDLSFCNQALADLRHPSKSIPTLHAEALWISAIARYFKCFGRNNARSHLSAKEVLKGHPGAEGVFRYFKALRDKHIVHDENPYSEAFTGVAINRKGERRKVADIIALAINAFTVDDAHLASFSPLVSVSLKWVADKQDELHKKLAQTWEKRGYEQLMALPDVCYTAPTGDKVHQCRTQQAPNPG
jgi:hypothetical protein